MGEEVGTMQFRVQGEQIKKRKRKKSKEKNICEKRKKRIYIYICYERERSRINRLERHDEMRVHEQDARWFKFLNLV
jgi:hypothetical protein